MSIGLRTKSHDRGRGTFVHILDDDSLFDIDEISLIPLFGLPILRFSNELFLSRVLGVSQFGFSAPLRVHDRVSGRGFFLGCIEAPLRLSTMGNLSHWCHDSPIFSQKFGTCL